MAKRHIDIMYFCAQTRGLRGEPEYLAWMEDVRRALAELGWAVTAQGPTGSSTNVDEDFLSIESAEAVFDRDAVKGALARGGISPTSYQGDVEGGFCWG